MEINQVATINGIDIFAISEGAKQYAPLRPICKALDIDLPSQLKKIKDDQFLSSVLTLKRMISADNKRYMMSVLPLEYIFGWLFTVNPKNVKPEAKEDINVYRMACYNAFIDYIERDIKVMTGNLKKQIEALEKRHVLSDDEILDMYLADDDYIHDDDV